ncbi:MAG TPA: methylmalonyl Co-A mutase-associated GTPase MeaB [Acidimicrobiales bacterium]|nr:methylmalonyl Co-A mutase-associated GTPase MeaB [Acidimicrobiales bacterium]
MGRDGRDATTLMDDAAGGDRRAVARLLSLVERGGDDARVVGTLAHARSGGAYTVGITGAPGAGKSTLTSALLGELRRRDERVAVLAIDPSSPFTGGAILGDRIRMQDHALDDSVFIRSMATRGHLGGLALATPQAVRVLDAAGFPWVLVETVGVGQVEVEIVGAADTTVVVVNPGWGDAVQANKAGLMEIADIFVINKADRPGADETRRDLEGMLDLTGVDGTQQAWRPPVLAAVATEGTGVAELWDQVLAHRAHLEGSGELDARRGRRAREELTRIVAERLLARARSTADGDRFEQLLDEVERRGTHPWAAADELLGPTP